MVDDLGRVVRRIDEMAEEFNELEPRERLELLLEYADGLPDLPPRYEALRAAGQNRVPECQTPVFLFVELQDGQVQLFAGVPPEAPTVKGFLGILVEAFSDALPEEVLAARPDLLNRFGLTEALGMVRMRGLSAIIHRIREEVRRATEAARSD